MAVEIDRALLDRRMLGGGFDDLSTWRTWIVVPKAAFGLPLDARERDTFAAVSGNRASPTQRVRETWCVAGRRSGKSRMAAAIAIYLALFQKYRLSAGERGAVSQVRLAASEAPRSFRHYRRRRVGRARRVQGVQPEPR